MAAGVRPHEFEIANAHKWKANICPMSSATLTEANGRVLATWETSGQVYAKLPPEARIVNRVGQSVLFHEFHAALGAVTRFILHDFGMHGARILHGLTSFLCSGRVFALTRA
jgi:hypothetical protein